MTTTDIHTPTLTGTNAADDVTILGYANEISLGGGDDTIRFQASKLFHENAEINNALAARVSGGDGADSFIFEGGTVSGYSAGSVVVIEDFELGTDALTFDVPEGWEVRGEFTDEGYVLRAYDASGDAQFLQVTLAGIDVSDFRGAGMGADFFGFIEIA